MNKELETEANGFAVDLLCPQESVRKSIEEGLSISDLADKYQVEECVIKEALKRSNKGRELLRKERDGWTHSELCRIAEEWLLRGNRCRVAIAEPNCVAIIEQPDAIGFSASKSYLIEAKTSRSDFLADQKKPFRKIPEYGMGNHRYYICKTGVISVNDLSNGWGLLNVNERGGVRTIRKSGLFRSVNKVAECTLLTTCLYIKKPLKVKEFKFNIVHTLWRDQG